MRIVTTLPESVIGGNGDRAINDSFNWGEGTRGQTWLLPCRADISAGISVTRTAWTETNPIPQNLWAYDPENDSILFLPDAAKRGDRVDIYFVPLDR